MNVLKCVSCNELSIVAKYTIDVNEAPYVQCLHIIHMFHDLQE